MMEMHHMDMRVGYSEGFPLDNPGLSCSSSSGSFSSASTSSSMPEPFTPTSGRSTPGFRTMSMDHDSVSYSGPGVFELTPPSSALGGYFPSDSKAEFQRYMEYGSASPSPTRKSSMQTQAMEFNYASMIPATYPSLPTQEQAIEAGNPQPLGHYSFSNYIASPQYPVPAPGYHFEDPSRDPASMWSWTSESPVSFFGRGHPSASPSPSQPLSARDRNGLPPPHLSHDRRRVNINKVQQKTTALQRVQRTQHRHGVRIERIAAATFKCNYPGCQKGPFKRQEHLKRHKNTKHADDPGAIITNCPFCKNKPFNRKDNYRQHLKLHTMKNRPTRRTDYHPEAQALLDEEINKTKQRSQLKNKGVTFKDED